MSESTAVVNGAIEENLQASDLVPLDSSDHVGTPTANFTVVYNGSTVSFVSGVPCVVDAALYAILVAASEPITWSS